MENAAKQHGFPSVSEYIRHLHNAAEYAEHSRKGTGSHTQRYKTPKQFFRTDLGRIFQGDSLGLMHKILKPESVDLIMTSPPFGLVRKKSYGNEDADRYLNQDFHFGPGTVKSIHHRNRKPKSKPSLEGKPLIWNHPRRGKEDSRARGKGR